LAALKQLVYTRKVSLYKKTFSPFYPAIREVASNKKMYNNITSFLDVNDILYGISSNKIFVDFLILSISRLDQGI